MRLKSSSISVQYCKRSQNLFEFTLVISETFITNADFMFVESHFK